MLVSCVRGSSRDVRLIILAREQTAKAVAEKRVRTKRKGQEHAGHPPLDISLLTSGLALGCDAAKGLVQSMDTQPAPRTTHHNRGPPPHVHERRQNRQNRVSRACVRNMQVQKGRATSTPRPRGPKLPNSCSKPGSEGCDSVGIMRFPVPQRCVEGYQATPHPTGVQTPLSAATTATCACPLGAGQRRLVLRPHRDSQTAPTIPRLTPRERAACHRGHPQKSAWS